jgi:hypothetical protein
MEGEPGRTRYTAATFAGYEKCRKSLKPVAFFLQYTENLVSGISPKTLSNI